MFCKMLKFMTRYNHLVRAFPQNANLKNNIPCIYHQFKQIRSSSTKNDKSVKNTILLRCRSSPMHQQHRRIYRKPPVISDNYNLVYEGPRSKGMKYLRWGTVFAATLAPFGHPLGALFGIIAVFVIHKTSKPYVTKLYFDADSRKFITETYSLLGLPIRFKFHVSQIELPHAPSQESKPTRLKLPLSQLELPPVRSKEMSTFRVLKHDFFLEYDVEETRQIFDFIREYNGEKTEEIVVSEDKKEVQSPTESVSVAQTAAAAVSASQTLVNSTTGNGVNEDMNIPNYEKSIIEETIDSEDNPNLAAVDSKVEEIFDNTQTFPDESVEKETIKDMNIPNNEKSIIQETIDSENNPNLGAVEPADSKVEEIFDNTQMLPDESVEKGTIKDETTDSQVEDYGK